MRPQTLTTKLLKLPISVVLLVFLAACPNPGDPEINLFGGAASLAWLQANPIVPPGPSKPAILKYNPDSVGNATAAAYIRESARSWSVALGLGKEIFVESDSGLTFQLDDSIPYAGAYYMSLNHIIISPNVLSDPYWFKSVAAHEMGHALRSTHLQTGHPYYGKCHAGDYQADLNQSVCTGVTGLRCIMKSNVTMTGLPFCTFEIEKARNYFQTTYTLSAHPDLAETNELSVTNSIEKTINLPDSVAAMHIKANGRVLVLFEHSGLLNEYDSQGELARTLDYHSDGELEGRPFLPYSMGITNEGDPAERIWIGLKLAYEDARLLAYSGVDFSLSEIRTGNRYTDLENWKIYGEIFWLTSFTDDPLKIIYASSYCNYLMEGTDFNTISRISNSCPSFSGLGKGTYVWFLNRDNVYRYNLASNPTGNAKVYPMDGGISMTFDCDTNIWVALQGINKIAKLNTTTESTTEYDAPEGPSAIAVDKTDTCDIFATASYAGKVRRYDSNGTLKSIYRTGDGPAFLGVNPASGKLWTANNLDKTISIINVD